MGRESCSGPRSGSLKRLAGASSFGVGRFRLCFPNGHWPRAKRLFDAASCWHYTSSARRGSWDKPVILYTRPAISYPAGHEPRRKVRRRAAFGRRSGSSASQCRLEEGAFLVGHGLHPGALYCGAGVAWSRGQAWFVAFLLLVAGGSSVLHTISPGGDSSLTRNAAGGRAVPVGEASLRQPGWVSCRLEPLVLFGDAPFGVGSDLGK